MPRLSDLAGPMHTCLVAPGAPPGRVGLVGRQSGGGAPWTAMTSGPPPPPVSWQESLFDPSGDPAGAAAGRPDLSFERLVRHRLDDRSWIDEAQGWLADHAELFDQLLREAPWGQRERWMYERRVLEPRMVAGWQDASLARLPPRLEELRFRLCERYGVEFDSVLVNLYRDGRDGVAWHGDTVR